MELQLHKIVPNPAQPRQTFSPASLLELAQSIHANGLIQPIVVEVDKDGRYILHDGERRWRASLALAIAQSKQSATIGLGNALITVIEEIAKADPLQVIEKHQAILLNAAHIDAVVVNEASQDDLLVRALVANIQREDLSPIEVAEACQELHNRGWTDQRIAEKMGSSRSAVANARRLLQLPADVADLVRDGAISERQAQALLPIYQLPESARKEVDGLSWRNTSEVVENAKNGTSSASLRSQVDNLIGRALLSIGDWPFMDYEFVQEGLQSGRCDGCPAIVKRSNEQYCPDKGCYQLKREAWAALRLTMAAKVSGLAAVEEVERPWTELERFYSSDSSHHAAAIIEKGCDNLRLKWETPHVFDAAPNVEGYPDVKILCHHSGKNHCPCLAAAKGQVTRNDPEKQEEKRRQKQIEEEIVEPATRVLAQAFANSEPGAWRLFTRYVLRLYNGQADDWTTEKIQERLARQFVLDILTCGGRENFSRAQKEVADFLTRTGLALPERSVLAGIKRRLDRIAEWSDQISKETPGVELDVNLTNLDKLVEEIDEIEGDDFDQEINALYRLSTRIFDRIDEAKEARKVDILERAKKARSLTDVLDISE